MNDFIFFSKYIQVNFLRKCGLSLQKYLRCRLIDYWLYKVSSVSSSFRLYDSIIQCLTETRQLPDLQDDENVERELNAQITSYKAFR